MTTTAANVLRGVVVHSLLWSTSLLMLNTAIEAAENGPRPLLRDFPPSPFDPSFATNTPPKPDRIVAQVERDLQHRGPGTNQAEIALIAEVSDLKNKLVAAQAAANAKDPLLQVYSRYIETTHDWVVKNHQREFGLANQYFQSNSTPSSQRILTSAVDLIDMALYKELATNTNFTGLFRSVFEALERKLPGQFAGSYARNDTLIGFQPTIPPGPAPSFDSYLREINQRYNLVMDKLRQIERENNMPPEVISGWMYGDLYRMLDGSAQLYVELNTPQEIEKLRRELQRKNIELSWLPASAR